MYGTVDRFDLTGLQPAYANALALTHSGVVNPNLTNVLLGTALAENTLNANAVHTIAANGATGGTFTLTWRGYTTTLLNYNDSAATVAAALNALTSMNGGAGVVGSGTAVNGAGLVLTWSGAGYTNKPTELPVLNIVSAFLTTQPTLVSTTAGARKGALTPYVSGGSNGSGVAVGINTYRFSSDAKGNAVFSDSATAGEEFGQKRLTVPYWIKGAFRIEDLVLTGTNALDATGAAQLGKVIRGSLTSAAGILVMT